MGSASLHNEADIKSVKWHLHCIQFAPKGTLNGMSPFHIWGRRKTKCRASSKYQFMEKDGEGPYI